jgi:hypothetical protein
MQKLETAIRKAGPPARKLPTETGWYEENSLLKEMFGNPYFCGSRLT